MESIEFKKLQDALRSSPTPQGKVAAAIAMKNYLSTPQGDTDSHLISMSDTNFLGNNIPVKDIPDHLQNNPGFFEFFNKIVNGESNE